MPFLNYIPTGENIDAAERNLNSRNERKRHVQALQTMGWEPPPIEIKGILRQIPFINGGHPSAIRPWENLRNRYYVREQAQLIARTNPPVKAAISPVTLSSSGFGQTYRLSDEALRQYSLGTFLLNAQQSYYQTRP